MLDMLIETARIRSSLALLPSAPSLCFSSLFLRRTPILWLPSHRMPSLAWLNEVHTLPVSIAFTPRMAGADSISKDIPLETDAAICFCVMRRHAFKRPPAPPSMNLPAICRLKSVDVSRRLRRYDGRTSHGHHDAGFFTR